MKRHSTDVVSLLFGLLFVALAGWWAASYYLNWVLDWHVPNFGWIAAGVLILLGLFGVVASLRRDRPEPALVEGPTPTEAPLSTATPTSAARWESTATTAGSFTSASATSPENEPPTVADAGPSTADLEQPRWPESGKPQDERY